MSSENGLRWLLAAVLLLGVLLQSPSLGMGFYADDYVHQLVLRGEVDLPHLAPHALYDFGVASDWKLVEGASGSLPWWTDGDWKIRFFRPLASLSLVLDHALFGSHAAGYHAMSLALYALALLLAHRLYRALGLAPGLALGALALFAATNGAALPVGWPANRNTLLGTLLTLAAVLAVVRPQEARRAGRIALALALALGACLCKESGVIALALVALRLWPLARARAEEGAASAPRAGVALALLLALGFLAFLAAAGYGTRSLFYATPWHEPLRFAGRVGVLATAGVLRLFAPVSLDLQTMKPQLALPIALMAAPLVLMLGLRVARRVGGDPRARFLAAWLALGLLPQGSAPASDRLLLDAAFGSAGILALYLGAVLGRQGRSSTTSPERFGARSLLFCAGPLCALFAFAQSAGISAVARDLLRRNLDTEVGSPALGRREIVVLQSASALIPFTLPATWSVESEDRSLRFWIFQMGRRGLEWTREDERSMVVRSLDEPFLTHLFERVYRSIPPPRAGARFANELFELEVLESEREGPRALRLVFSLPLDAPRLIFLADREGVLRAIPPPAIGETKLVPPPSARGPMDL